MMPATVRDRAARRSARGPVHHLPVPGIGPVIEYLARRRTRRTALDLYVWLNFRVAAYRHRIGVYDGDVFVLTSRDRIRHSSAGRWRSVLKGAMEIRDIGSVHRDVFDPSHAQMVESLREYARTRVARE